MRQKLEQKIPILHPERLPLTAESTLFLKLEAGAAPLRTQETERFVKVGGSCSPPDLNEFVKSGCSTFETTFILFHT
jgi:hypothetical protein